MKRGMDRKAVVYGGGNIGRGFIGPLLSQSDYRVTFIDVAEPVVAALSQRHTYPVRYVDSRGHEDVWIEQVTAVNGNDREAAAQAIAECGIMATAVGARVLKFIVPNIVEGLRRRWAAGGGALNIIICENLMDANKVLEGLLKEHLTEEECARFDESVGLVEASIGRMVPVQTEEMKAGDPLRVCVERYGFLPVDKAAFKGDIPAVVNMAPFAPFDFYIKRKLYVHNMGHAVCAYLGDYLGLEYICEAIDRPEILLMVQNAMMESALALSSKYAVPLADIQRHIMDLLYRFTNAALQDTCRRVGGDPARKLGPDDRLIGSAQLVSEQGMTPAYIAIGAAAGLLRYIEENDGLEQSLESAERVLTEVSGLPEEDALRSLILDYYAMLLEKKTLHELYVRAQAHACRTLKNVI